MNTTELSTWNTPATIYPRKKFRAAEISKTRYPRGLYLCYMQRGYDYFEATKPLTITSLKINGKVWMVDDPPHWWAMQEHAASFKGHVVCAGLGLGLMAHALSENTDVTKVTIVERNKAVINLVGPRIPKDDRLNIEHGDWWEFESSERVDGVLFDLFVGDARQLLGEAFAAAEDALRRFGEHISVRVHGFANPMIEHGARATLALRKEIENG